MRQFQPEEHEPLWHMLLQLIRPLIEKHPLPWATETDWTEEVHDADGALVMKCMNHGHATFFIALAAEIAQEDEDWERKLGRAVPRLVL